MKCAILKYGFHSTGLAPEGDIFLSVTFPENSSLIQNFTATLTEAAADEERAKKMYLDTLAPGTVSPPVLLGEPQDDAKVNIYILGLIKYTVTYVPVFLCTLTMFIVRIKRIISRGKWFNHVRFILFGKCPKFGSVRRHQKEKNGLTLYVNNTSVCMWTTPPLSVSHQTFLFI